MAVQFNSGMRNLSAGAVLAVRYFPPSVALPVISGMLFQQILAACSGMFIRSRVRRRQLADPLADRLAAPASSHNS
ncbi:hypothetical protein ACFTAO_13600 [Paenibacillus rhizoplanae]